MYLRMYFVFFCYTAHDNCYKQLFSVLFSAHARRKRSLCFDLTALSLTCLSPLSNRAK